MTTTHLLFQEVLFRTSEKSSISRNIINPFFETDLCSRLFVFFTILIKRSLRIDYAFFFLDLIVMTTFTHEMEYHIYLRFVNYFSSLRKYNVESYSLQRVTIFFNVIDYHTFRTYFVFYCVVLLSRIIFKLERAEWYHFMNYWYRRLILTLNFSFMIPIVFIYRIHDQHRDLRSISELFGKKIIIRLYDSSWVLDTRCRIFRLDVVDILITYANTISSYGEYWKLSFSFSDQLHCNHISIFLIFPTKSI